MDITPNIFNAIAFDLHPKVKELLDKLDSEGQIDHDESGSPHVMSIESPAASTFHCVFVRNGRPVTMLVHSRKKADPIMSFDPSDGYKRKEIVAIGSISRKERQLRAFESITEAILPSLKKYEVIIQDLRPGMNLKKYRKVFDANSKQDAYEKALITLHGEDYNYNFMKIERVE